MEGRALVAQLHMRLLLYGLTQGARDAALADPGLAAEQHHLPFARLGCFPPAAQQIDFLFPAYERCLFVPQGIEPAFRGACAQHLAQRDGLGETLDHLGTAVAELEETAEQPARRWTDDDCVGRSQ